MTETKKKISILHDNPEIAGRKYFLISMISPVSRQKHSVYALKLHDVCGTQEEADMLKEYYHALDPDFDIYVSSGWGKWFPLIFDEDTSGITSEYADSALTELVRSKRQEVAKNNHDFEKRRIDAHIKKSEERVTIEEQEKVTQDECAVSMLCRIKQLELLITRRNQELDSLHSIYQERYTDEEKAHASSLEHEFPLSEPSQVRYNNPYAFLDKNGKDTPMLKHPNEENNEAGPSFSSSSSSNLPSKQPENVPQMAYKDIPSTTTKKRTLVEIRNEIRNEILSKNSK
jgi:hypothetical protein